MMFTLALLYVYLYILIMVIIFYLLTSLLPISYFTNYSLNLFIIFIKKYTNYQSIFFNSFICLSGLPPVGLFLVKFNILNYIISQTHFIMIFLFYLVFLLNMFYYLQIFNFKNLKYNLSHMINCNIFKYWFSYNYFYSLNYNLSIYFYYFYTVLIFFFFFFFLWFFLDLFYIINYFFFFYVNKKSVNKL
jgi:hypothetical protein